MFFRPKMINGIVHFHIRLDIKYVPPSLIHCVLIWKFVKSSSQSVTSSSHLSLISIHSLVLAHSTASGIQPSIRPIIMTNLICIFYNSIEQIHIQIMGNRNETNTHSTHQTAISSSGIINNSSITCICEHQQQQHQQ